MSHFDIAVAWVEILMLPLTVGAACLGRYLGRNIPQED